MKSDIGQDGRVFPVKVDQSGRVSIPMEIREKLGLKRGSRVHWVRDESGVRIETPEEARHALQVYFQRLVAPGESLANELIEERRAEAERESRD